MHTQCRFNVAAHPEVQARIKGELGSAGLLHAGQPNCVTPRFVGVGGWDWVGVGVGAGVGVGSVGR